MKLTAIMKKDALLLVRDRAGLGILFFMPIAMALIVTLIQEDAFRVVGSSATELILVNNDPGPVARDLTAALDGNRQLRVDPPPGGSSWTDESARAAVARGDASVCLILPAGFSERAQRGTEQRVRRAARSAQGLPDPGEDSPGLNVLLCFDPAMRSVHRRVVTASIQTLLIASEYRLAMDTVARLMNPNSSAATIGKDNRALFAVVEETPLGGEPREAPSSVQQNVPAWTLFAMFMIVIPLSGTIIREREMGTLTRLKTLPVSYASLLAGKIGVYVLVGLLQFAVLLWIGAEILPRLGTPDLVLGPNLVALVVTAVVCALAATGLGLLIATAARTQEQAALFGATFVVIAGALGGIMAPVSLMPRAFQSISGFSPLNWGLQAFLDLILHQGTLLSVAGNLAKLLAFFGVTLILSILLFLRRD